MADRFKDRPTQLDSPARRAAAVTPNDGADLTDHSRALYVGTAGNVSVVTQGGDTVIFTAVSGLLPICVRRVLSTGTTATNIVSLW